MNCPVYRTPKETNKHTKQTTYNEQTSKINHTQQTNIQTNTPTNKQINKQTSKQTKTNKPRELHTRNKTK